MNEIRFIDLFSGIGGFRLGLQRANKSSWQHLPKWTRSGGSPDSETDGANRNFKTSSTKNSCSQNTKRTNNNESCRGSRQSLCDFEKRGGGNIGDSNVGSPTFHCVWSCDINEYANRVYIRHFGEENHYSGDIKRVDPTEIPDFDLLCAGFPCQSFSVAGKGLGFQDTRGSLFFQISRIARAKKPKMLLLENVRGLLSNDRGQTFHTILRELGRLGYWVEWQILNSKHFGVPQNRERVFIIGHLRTQSFTPIFPIAENTKVAPKKSKRRPSFQAEISTAIDANYYKGVDRHGQRLIILDTFNQRVRIGEMNTLKTNSSPSSSSIIALLPQYGSMRSQKPQGWWEPAHTVRQDLSRNIKKPHNPVLLPDLRIRRLTPVECERLQGFPDNWTEFGYMPRNVVTTKPIYGWRLVENENGESEWKCVKVGEEEIEPVYDAIRISDTQRYKMLGNAVTVNVIEFLGRKIREIWSCD